MSNLCAIDMGSSQFKLLIASFAGSSSGELEILGAGAKKCESAISDGKPVDHELATQTLKAVYEEVLNVSGVKAKDIEHFFVNITGSHIKGYEGTQNNFVSIEHSDRRIRKSDIDRVIQNSHAEGLLEDSYILDKIPRGFSVDSTPFIRNPKGLEGKKLTVNTYIIATNKYQINNLSNILSDAMGVKRPIFVLNSIASSFSSVNDDQKEIGVIVIDIGGGNVDIAAFNNGSLLFTHSFPGGGKSISFDIAKDFSMSLEDAEKLKVNFEKCQNSGKISVPIRTIGGYEIEARIPNVRKDISEKINEIFGNTYNKLQYYLEQEHFAAGIVLTGGASKTFDIMETARAHFPLMVQMANYHNTGIAGCERIEQPYEFATALGLLKWGREYVRNKREHKGVRGKSGNLLDMFKKMFNDLKE